jgi:hypothetical protein
MALHLRARQPRLASAPSQLVESFQQKLEFARIAKLALDAMGEFSDAQGPLGETAQPCEAIDRIAFLRRSSLGKDVSRDTSALVNSAPALRVDEDT